MRIFENLESQVQGYTRSAPVLFTSAKGSIMVQELNTLNKHDRNGFYQLEKET